MSAAETNRAQNNIDDRRMARMAMAFDGVVVVDRSNGQGRSVDATRCTRHRQPPLHQEWPHCVGRPPSAGRNATKGPEVGARCGRSDGIWEIWAAIRGEDGSTGGRRAGCMSPALRAAVIRTPWSRAQTVSSVCGRERGNTLHSRRPNPAGEAYMGMIACVSSAANISSGHPAAFGRLCVFAPKRSSRRREPIWHADSRRQLYFSKPPFESRQR